MSYSGIQTSLLTTAKDLLITELFCLAKPALVRNRLCQYRTDFWCHDLRNR